MSGFGNTTDLLAASVSLSVCGLTGILQLPPPPLPEAAYAVLSGKGELGVGRDGRHLLSFAEGETAQRGEGTCPKSHSK